LGSEDLALGSGDAARMFAGFGLELDAQDLSTLVERTEGWPAALYLAVLSLRPLDVEADPVGPSSFTTAELRVLQYLPTYLTLGEIADRLYVSRNTVKSQTIAIYRKMGTSSRAGAVRVAHANGLIDYADRPA
jgi:ATP/maltotriose-dependent transcriptional regulator MalT